MKSRQYFGIISLILLVAMTACGENGDKKSIQPEETVTVGTVETSDQSAVMQTDPAISDEAPLEETPIVQPGPGGIITIDCKNPQTFNPIINEDLSVDRFLRLIYEPLIALDESQKPSPALASSWEFAPDGTSLTIHINPAANWADGTPVAANDVMYTLDQIENLPATSLYNSCFENIASYSGEGKDVKIMYTKPFPGALYNLTFPVIPKHHFTSGTVAKPVTEPLGSGMYKLSTYNRMKNAKLIASENSYRGKPKISEINALIVRTDDVPLYSYDQKLIDIAETHLSDWKKISMTRPSNVFRYTSQNYEFIAFNFRNTSLQNLDVRKAIAYALPKNEIIDKAYAGNAFATDTPISESSWLYELGTAIYDYDMEKAKECLAAAGSAYSGAPLTVLVNGDNDERVFTSKRLTQELAKIGVITKIEYHPYDEYKNRLENGDFDIAVCGINLALYPDLSPFLSSDGRNNFTGYKNAAMDGYFTQLSTTVFESAQLSAFSNIQKQFADDLPYVSVGYKAGVVLTGENVFGDVKPVVNNAYNNIGELLISSQTAIK